MKRKGDEILNIGKLQMRGAFCRTSVTAILLAILLLFGVGIVFAASGGGEHGGEHAAPKGWVATDTYKVMNFAVLAIGLFFVLKKPVSQALNDRIKGIKDQLEDLETKKKEAEKELEGYAQRLTQMDKEADSIIQQYVEQGKKAKEKILKEAQDAAEKLEAQAQRNIEHEFEKARNNLKEEVLEKAFERAEGLIKSSITDQDQDRLVDEYLKKVVA
jgi:F-type H+-transporting ATPase subunit b